MKISIEEMKLVDSAKNQLEQLALQFAAKQATMKQEAINEACMQFKTYFANRSFAFSGSAWNLIATHGSIIFKLVIKNAPTGGAECLILHYPDMMKTAPVTIFLEAKHDDAADHPIAAAEQKSLLTEMQEKVALMQAKLKAPPKIWSFYTLEGEAARRKDYVSFARFLGEECP